MLFYGVKLMVSRLAWLYWDPPINAFTIPFLEITVAWYGILFAFGFVLGYFILIPILKQFFAHSRPHASPEELKALSTTCADRLTWFIVLGTIIGARLGQVLFYEWPYYSANPIEILMIRKGGLASHGGTLGVILSLILFLRFQRKQFPEIALVPLFDLLVIPTAMAVTFIRIANFFNQEILGTTTWLPWGIIFGHAADGSAPVPRHPVQLYEALAYLVTFAILYVLWRVRGTSLKPGILSGIFFVLVFGSRFFIEFLKAHQSSWLDFADLQMGQYLSIPFVCLGLALIFTPENVLKRLRLA